MTVWVTGAGGGCCGDLVGVGPGGCCGLAQVRGDDAAAGGEGESGQGRTENKQGGEAARFVKGDEEGREEQARERLRLRPEVLTPGRGGQRSLVW